MVNFMADITRAFGGVIQALVAWSAAMLTGFGIQMRLTTLPAPLSPTTVWSAVVEPTYSGYAPIDITTLSDPASQDGQSASIVSPQLIFAQNGGPNSDTVTGAVIVSQIPASTRATGTVTTTAGVISAPVITAAGAGYTAAPAVTVLGGGNGAVVTATVVGGVVTALTVVSGGTGYTAATLVIDPPLQVIGFYNFPQPIPMTNAFSQIPITAEFDMAP